MISLSWCSFSSWYNTLLRDWMFSIHLLNWFASWLMTCLVLLCSYLFKIYIYNSHNTTTKNLSSPPLFFYCLFVLIFLFLSLFQSGSVARNSSNTADSSSFECSSSSLISWLSLFLFPQDLHNLNFWRPCLEL